MKNEAPASTPSHDEQVLQKHLSLPGVPLEVSFEQAPRTTSGGLGPTDYILVALVRLKKETLAHLADASQPRPGNPPRISVTANRPWFPAAVKAAIEHQDDTGVAIRGRKFDAGPLLKMPYTSGYFVIVDSSDYVIISAQTN